MKSLEGDEELNRKPSLSNFEEETQDYPQTFLLIQNSKITDEQTQDFMRCSIKETQSKIETLFHEELRRQSFQPTLKEDIEHSNEISREVSRESEPKFIGENISVVTQILEKLVHFQQMDHKEKCLKDMKWSVSELQSLTNIFKTIVQQELEK